MNRMETTMSVIAYTANELGAVARPMTHEDYGNKDEARRRWAEKLAKISGGNAQAYRETYGDEMVPVSAGQIEAAAQRGGFDYDRLLDEAIRVVTCLRYNCIANNGADYGCAEALLDVVGAMFSIVRDRMEAMESR